MKKPDMSGSISKNRFRSELLWGIDRLLNCLDRGIENFAVVFDYCCDIELHLDDSYEFYQVKTSAAKKFSVSWASRLNPTSNVSIVGRLYELHDIESDSAVKLIIVGNKPFAKKNPVTKKSEDFDCPGELLFSTLHDEDKQKIEESIKAHLPNVKPDLNKLSYILVTMDLSNPDDSIRGHLVRSYENSMGCEPRKPNALYWALKGLVEEKACEEERKTSYEDVISSKGITNKELSRLFESYADRENSQHDFVMRWINKQPPLQRIDLKCAYEEVISNLYKPQGQNHLKACIEIVTKLDNSLSENEIVRLSSDSFEVKDNIEITDSMRKIYSILALYELTEKRS